jgi:hypothetical protein
VTSERRDDRSDGAALFERSILVRGAQRAIQALDDASARSSALARARAVGREYGSAPLRRQITLAGAALVAFAATYFALMLTVPERMAPLFPALVWGLAGAAGVFCLGAADALAAAIASKRSSAAQKNPA